MEENQAVEVEQEVAHQQGEETLAVATQQEVARSQGEELMRVVVKVETAQQGEERKPLGVENSRWETRYYQQALEVRHQEAATENQEVVETEWETLQPVSPLPSWKPSA